MKQLYADFNDVTADGILPLTAVGSAEAIAGLGGELEEGEAVLLTDGELRVTARVFRGPDGSWEAHSNWEFEGDTEEGSGHTG